MKKHVSVLKRARQSRKRRERNRAVLSSLKTMVKKFNSAVGDKKPDEAQVLSKKAVSAYDRAASKGIIHRNRAIREVSRLTLKVNKMLSSEKTA